MRAGMSDLLHYFNSFFQSRKSADIERLMSVLMLCPIWGHTHLYVTATVTLSFY